MADWSMGSRAVPLIGLGCTYDEQFRQHLHGEAEFPRNAVLWVAVVRSEEPPPLVNFPVGEIEAKASPASFRHLWSVLHAFTWAAAFRPT